MDFRIMPLVSCIVVGQLLGLARIKYPRFLSFHAAINKGLHFRIVLLNTQE